MLGKAPGRTTLTLLGGDGKLISNVEVQVAPDVAEFKERLRQILPGETIEVRTANDGIVLSGTVSSTAKLDRALDLANRYAPEHLILAVADAERLLKEETVRLQALPLWSGEGAAPVHTSPLETYPRLDDTSDDKTLCKAGQPHCLAQVRARLQELTPVMASRATITARILSNRGCVVSRPLRAPSSTITGAISVATRM